MDLPEEEKQLSQKEKLEKAQKLVSNNEYRNKRGTIMREVSGCLDQLLEKTKKPSAESEYDLFRYVFEVGNCDHDTGDPFTVNLYNRKKIDCSTACLL